MIRSMTGFGRGEYSDEISKVTVEIRSVNHRYLDIYVKMPRRYSFAEETIKSAIKERLHRGKVEVSVSVDNIGKSDSDIRLDKELAARYYNVLSELRDSFDYAVPVSCIPAFISDLKALAASYNTGNNIVAHIADGNVHGDMWYVDGKTPEYADEYKRKMYDLVFKYNGTITGEHGIGKIRREDLKLQLSETELSLMRGIKNVFDPKGLLNPGTVL